MRQEFVSLSNYCSFTISDLAQTGNWLLKLNGLNRSDSKLCAVSTNTRALAKILPSSSSTWEKPTGGKPISVKNGVWNLKLFMKVWFKSLDLIGSICSNQSILINNLPINYLKLLGDRILILLKNLSLLRIFKLQKKTEFPNFIRFQLNWEIWNE